MNKTYRKTANLVLGYLELRFINLHKEAEVAEKERALWASELENKIEADRITQLNIVKACDLWADINTNGGLLIYTKKLRLLRKNVRCGQVS